MMTTPALMLSQKIHSSHAIHSLWNHVVTHCCRHCVQKMHKKFQCHECIFVSVEEGSVIFMVRQQW